MGPKDCTASDETKIPCSNCGPGCSRYRPPSPLPEPSAQRDSESPEPKAVTNAGEGLVDMMERKLDELDAKITNAGDWTQKNTGQRQPRETKHGQRDVVPNAEEVEVESERWNRDEHGYWRNSRGESASGEYHSRALDTIARLTREVANLKLEHGRLYDQLDDGMLRVIEQIDDSHAELRREMGEAQKDTARWRYLRAHCAPPGTPEYNEPWFAVAPPEQYAVRSGAELDAAIDSALAPVPGERGDTTQTTESNT
jgi:hypothetical protein